MAQRIVTFTTDFGINDHFVGTMKGVVLGINPEARIVDICNSVQSFDVLDGALTIAQAYSYFPKDTVHVVIIDPGVGTARRPILVTTATHILVAPDNGVLSLIYDREERVTVRHINAEHYFLQPVSQTFHGRDIFSAVAGHLSKGVDVEKFGEVVTDYVRFAPPRPRMANGVVKGVIIKVDKFGNLITNITAHDVPQLFATEQRPFRILIGKQEITKMNQAYAQGAPGEVFGILDSMGFLEIAANRAAAVQLVGAGKGSEVGVILG